MSRKAQVLNHELFADLLSIAACRPSRRCTYHKLLRTPTRRYASSRSTTTPPSPTGLPPAPGSHVPLRMLLDRNPENRSAISKIPIPKGERGEKFTPQPLARPLGLPHPPQPGQNSPVDNRTLAEKKADFGSYEKAMERRRLLFRQFLRPYFQEQKRLDHHKGKSFMSNERLFKREKALWFPNLWGATLSKEGDGVNGGRDITPVLSGKVTIVGIQSGVWAEEQVGTFLGEKDNPELKALLDGSGGLLQRVDVNIQGDWVRSLLVKLFKGRLRKTFPEEQWGRYFMVKLARDVGKGLTEDVRDAVGLLNSQVGYVYLLDTDCRIRWAGSGHAWPGEVEGLNRGIRRLLEEAREGTRIELDTRSSASRKLQPRGTDLKREVEKAVV